VAVRRLRAVGFQDGDFRWLRAHHLAEHVLETTPTGQRHRTFRGTRRLVAAETSALVLTFAGAEAARALLECPATAADGLPLPCYDADRRELRLGDAVVKRYRQPAPDQELVLVSFEEQGWPPRIDDPLPLRPEVVPDEHRRQTIKNLNHWQLRPLLHFRADGTGTGIQWRRCA
jgi:hypothetical protein